MRTDDVVVLAPGVGRVFELTKGERLRIQQTEGGQVADVVAFATQRPDEWLSCPNTVMYNMNLWLVPGSTIYSNRSRAMLTLVADTVGMNNLFLGGCTLESYQLRFGRDHSNCHDVLRTALEDYGWNDVEPPPPLNFFMNWPLHGDGSLEMGSSPAGPTDFVEVRAEIDLLFVISVCPQDLTPTNRFRPTPLGVSVTGAE